MNNKKDILKKEQATVNADNNPLKMLEVFEEKILNGIESEGLPVKNVLVEVEERATVFRNVGSVLKKIERDQKEKSIYLSKFLAASAVGLFDAALNYLWDETISEIRKRVIQYDVSYFYDNVPSSDDKRKRLKTSDDIVKIDDADLIQGARNIGLISELGLKHLDYIRYMRNWASAAHPNQNQLTGLSLVSW